MANYNLLPKRKPTYTEYGSMACGSGESPLLATTIDRSTNALKRSRPTHCNSRLLAIFAKVTVAA